MATIIWKLKLEMILIFGKLNSFSQKIPYGPFSCGLTLLFTDKVMV